MGFLYVKWDFKYKLETDHINDQHKRLFALINQAYDVMNSPAGPEGMLPVLEGLSQYADTHFTYEEKLMSRYSYPRLSVHRQMHQAYIQRIAQARADVRLRKPSVKAELMQYLRDWLLDHILVEDRKYDEFFITQRVPEAVGRKLY